MSESTSNPGKGLGVTGFVLALVAIVGWFIVSAMAIAAAGLTGGGMGLIIFWCVFSAIALLLSYLGFKKSSAVGAKKGLAVAGIVIGAVALALSIWSTIGVNAVVSSPELGKFRNELKDELNKGLDHGMEDLKHTLDSLENAH